MPRTQSSVRRYFFATYFTLSAVVFVFVAVQGTLQALAGVPTSFTQLLIILLYAELPVAIVFSVIGLSAQLLTILDKITGRNRPPPEG